MITVLFYTIIGYISGSLLPARFFSRLFCGRDVTEDSPDKNPGTFNAFTYGGFWCGALTLICDLLKSFLPVFLYLMVAEKSAGLVFVMLAPVLGHIFPVFHHFDGGKGIAASFGVLLGLAPDMRPVVILGAMYLLYSFIFKVNPHFYRLVLTYSSMVVLVTLLRPGAYVVIGCIVVSAAVIGKLIAKFDADGKMKITPVWKQ